MCKKLFRQTQWTTFALEKPKRKDDAFIDHKPHMVEDSTSKNRWLAFCATQQINASVICMGSYFVLYLEGIEPEKIQKLISQIVQKQLKRMVRNLVCGFNHFATSQKGFMIWAKGTMFIFERGASISDESREFFVAQKLSVSTFLPERVKTTIRSFTLQFHQASSSSG